MPVHCKRTDFAVMPGRAEPRARAEQGPVPPHGCGAVLLAAGGGTRLGGGKQLLPWRGKPLAAHALEAVLRVRAIDGVAVVLGHEAEAVRAALTPYAAQTRVPLRFVHNAQWEQGQSGSVRCGLETLLAAPETASMAAVLVLLADQPLVLPRTLRLLLAAHRAASGARPDHPATAPVYAGRRGNPVVLSRELFPQLLTLTGDRGARRLLEEAGNRVLRLPVRDPGVLHDVDTPEAYAALCAQE